MRAEHVKVPPVRCRAFGVQLAVARDQRDRLFKRGQRGAIQTAKVAPWAFVKCQQAHALLIRVQRASHTADRLAHLQRFLRLQVCTETGGIGPQRLQGTVGLASAASATFGANSFIF